MSQKPFKTPEKDVIWITLWIWYIRLCDGIYAWILKRPPALSSHHYSLAKHGLTWNQMALTILLRTNRGRTQRALKTEVRMNSNQDHTLPWREGSPGVKTACWLTDPYHKPAPDSQAAIHTNDFCCESLQQWDKHPVEEKQTELERENKML